MSARLLVWAIACLVVGSCTSDGETTNGPVSSERPEATTTTAGVTAATTTRPPSPTNSTVAPPPRRPETVAEYEELWSQERRAIVDNLNSDSSNYGLGEDGVLRGPGGFSFDTASCPADWSNAAGIVDNTVTLIHLAPLTHLTNIGDLATGAEHYFAAVNARGGVGPDGLQIELAIENDAYHGPLALQVVEEAIEEDRALAVIGLGMPGIEAVNGELNDQCVPLLMGITGSPILGDATGHPWSTGLEMTQTTEALLWLRWIEANLDPPVRVAALVMDNSFGHTYERVFTEAAATSDMIERFDAIRHDPATSTLTAEMAEVVALEPDVYISMTAGNPCLVALQQAGFRDLAVHASVRLTSSFCTRPAAYMVPAGEAGDGWLALLGGVRDPTDERWADDPWIKHVNQQLQESGVETGWGLQGEGFGHRGWALHQVLEIASALDGGLTRTNLVLAQRSLTEMTHPMLYPGVHFGMNGSEDPYFIEGSAVAHYNTTLDRWDVAGVIDINGQTPPCQWVSDKGCAPDP